jgi:alpha-L-fucosidase 2
MIKSIMKQRCQLNRRAFLKTVGGTLLAAPLSAVYAASVRQPAPSSGALGPMALPVSAAREADWPTVSALLDDASPSYTETWDDANCRTLHKGAYLGNGDFGAHLGGTIHSLKYYLGKNGFHAGNDVAAGQWTQHILNLAILTIEKSSGTDSGSAYNVTQDLKNAEIRTDCSMAGSAVQTKAYIAGSSNALVLEMSTDSGNQVPLQATLSVIGNEYVAKDAGSTGSVAWVTKEPNADGAPFYVKGAIAAKVLDAKAVLTTNSSSYSRLAFTLPANGAMVKLFLQAEHSKNADAPLPSVQSVVQDMTKAGIADLYVQNKAWWKDFWLQSYIELGDELQQYWYNHLYLIGACARSSSDNRPGKAPGHWGPWNRRDDMMWFSNLGMNYNAQNPYYGAFSSNRVDLVDPYIQTIKYYAENTGRKRVVNRWVSPTIEARMPENCRGVAFELSFTSHGTSCGGGSWVHQDGSMPTNAVFGILPIVWKWKYGQDSAFLADTCYPLMLAVADFFDDYIGQAVNGQYDVYGCVHEGANWFSANDMFSLGSIRFLYREIIDASIKLGRDAQRRAHWQDILDRMSKYRLQKWGNTVTFRPDGIHDVMDALSFQGGARNTGLMFTTTFDNISHRTLPAYKIATCNTLDKGNMFHPQRFGGWQDSNDFGMMFVMAVRAGYRPDRVIEAIKGWKPELNGIVSQKRGGGIETAGIIEAINSMLMQSHDGVIRIFSNWDKTIDAQFKRLRAQGAFLVEAKYTASTQGVDSVRIFSEKGKPCVVQSPFAGAGITVTRADNQQAIATVQNEEEFSFGTTAGVTYSITRAEHIPAPAGSPVITAHPIDTMVVLPAPATFSVSASGTGLSYQWQKNRADIPGATSSSYRTAPTTLWDIGSAYRCLVTNSFGTVRSNPGILNPMP